MATNEFYSDATSRVDQMIQDYYGSEQNLMKSLEFQPIDVASNAGVFNSKLEGFFARRRAAQNQGYLTKRTRVQPGEQFIKRDADGRNIVKSFKIRTIYDMMRVDYPHIYSDDMLNAITKADAPYLSSSTAMYNAVHGAEAVHQIIQEDNVRRLLPKVPYLRGGVRFITAAGTTSGVGIAENAAVPDTVSATLANVDYGIKERSYSFNVSARMEFLSMLEDDAWSQGGGAFAAARLVDTCPGELRTTHRSGLAQRQSPARRRQRISHLSAAPRIGGRPLRASRGHRGVACDSRSADRSRERPRHRTATLCRSSNEPAARPPPRRSNGRRSGQ